ncbi:MAG TPA: hypothetical protein VNI20_08285 [Fimbriimonadaceae bacterium]|nr:hypothetical protein [Fimbriimonadaceae bacterium]
MAYKRIYSTLMAEVERILLTKWDPIHVKGYPMAEGEYLSYAGIVTGMLVRGTTASAVAEYLSSVETDRMGLNGNPQHCTPAAQDCCSLMD